MAFLEIKRTTKRYWWPHPYAVDAGKFWVYRLGFRYFVDGVEVNIDGTEVRR